MIATRLNQSGGPTDVNRERFGLLFFFTTCGAAKVCKTQPESTRPQAAFWQLVKKTSAGSPSPFRGVSPRSSLKNPLSLFCVAPSDSSLTSRVSGLCGKPKPSLALQTLEPFSPSQGLLLRGRLLKHLHFFSPFPLGMKFALFPW